MLEHDSHLATNSGICASGCAANLKAFTNAAFQTRPPWLPGCVNRRIGHADYRFSHAHSWHDIESAAELVAKRYAWRGYRVEEVLKNVRPTKEVTLIASSAGQVHGTLTVRIDGRTSLLSETLYPEEIHGMRTRGAKLCEFGRLAFQNEVNTLEILGPLFHLAVTYSGGLNECTDAVIEVNPRHEGFYRRLFGFEVLGTKRICPRVAAPAVLLRLPLGQATLRARTEGGRRAGRHSIYPYCFGHDELDPQRDGRRAASHIGLRPVSARRDVIYS